MATKPKVIIVEDKDEDRREVLNCLADSAFCDGEDILGTPATYDDALAVLREKAAEVDVVLLDLNLPREERDARPEKGHGKAILDHIHLLNRGASIHIRVIVVSAEELAESWDGELLKQAYPDTLVGVVRKADLKPMLRANLKRLRRDPLRDRIRRLGVDVLDQYDVTFDPTYPIGERVKEARRIAIRLVRYELDQWSGRVGASDGFADKLIELIKQVEDRFAPSQRDGRRRIDVSALTASGGWGAFLWRGTLVQHLYTLNSYRNDYEHINEKPFRGDGTTTNQWSIPPEVLDSLERGDTVGKIVELIVREILEWYLPWHEQVYLPWSSIAAGGRP
jgi:CheY-like chemotaxis protein